MPSSSSYGRLVQTSNLKINRLTRLASDVQLTQLYGAKVVQVNKKKFKTSPQLFPLQSANSIPAQPLSAV